METIALPTPASGLKKAKRVSDHAQWRLPKTVITAFIQVLIYLLLNLIEIGSDVKA